VAGRVVDEQGVGGADGEPLQGGLVDARSGLAYPASHDKITRSAMSSIPACDILARIPGQALLTMAAR